ncbi:MAG: alkaline phosphatase family protein [bacterium]|nr:alkaline phosphatase family protein [bacterium]
MMNEFLIIFIDSLPYSYALQMPIAKRFPTQLPLTPGFGYSINIQAELFAGKTPDELGYLSEWTYARTDSPFWKYRYLFRCLSPCSTIYILDRIMHRLGNKIFGTIWNIPFRYLPQMKSQPDIFSTGFQAESIFTQQPEIKRFVYPDYPGPNRDERMTTAALDAIQTHSRLFVGLVDLDGVTHQVGVGTPEYESKINRLNELLTQLVDRFQKQYPNGNILIVSDHGMANVHGSIALSMESRFGNPNPETYFYIQDSTMLRVWCFNDEKKTEIERFLATQNYGKMISSDERKRYRITSSQFGTIIFLLNEGLVFSPSFYGRKIPKAMHGYLPDLKSQIGAMLYTQPIPDSIQPIENTKDIYKLITTEYTESTKII